MGRTLGSTTLHPDEAFHLWLAIRILCETTVTKTGRKLTAHAAGKKLFDSGGFVNLEGGDRGTIAKENLERKRKLIEMCVISKNGKAQLAHRSDIKNEADVISQVFVTHQYTNMKYMMNRYYWYNGTLKANPFTNLTRNNVLRDCLGLTRLPTPWARLGGRVNLKLTANWEMILTN